MAGPFDRVFADVRKDLPSAPDAVVRQEIFRVLDDFTQMTNIWQETFEVVIQPTVQSYTLPAPDEGKTHRLLAVYDVTSVVRNWPMRGIAMRVPGVLTLSHKPSMSATWGVIVSKRTAEPLGADKYPEIDDWIVETYADTLGKGILARLMIEPQKPYSNPLLAQVNQRAYVSGRSLARVNDEHANVKDAQNWQFPQGWGTVQKKGFV